MPLFHINHRNLDGVTPTTDSQGYADIKTARNECLASAKQIISERLASGEPLSALLHQSFEVADEGGNTVLTALFADALEADTQDQPAVVNEPDGVCGS